MAELRGGGNQVDSLTAAQQEVLRGLTPAEVATLNSVKARIDAATADVEGHAVWVGGVVF